MKILFLAVCAVAVLCVDSWAEEGARKEGMLSEGSFLSDAISSAAEKINRVASGEEPIVDDDAKGIDDDILEYDGNPFGRTRPLPRRMAQADYGD